MEGMTQKGGHKRPTDQGAGLTQKGVEKYRRQNPGSKLQTSCHNSSLQTEAGSKGGPRDARVSVREAEVGQENVARQRGDVGIADMYLQVAQ